MTEFKKGQIIKLKYLMVSKELRNLPARIINITKDSIRVRFQSPIHIKMGKKIVGGVYTTTASPQDVEFDAIKTLKSVMRSNGKKNIKRTVKKTKTNKRTSKGRGNTSTTGNAI